ncbi:hypothetical protein PHYBOEH_010320 [Phytophthora boehmeriae]|uniref:WW domain-containing protein n=1 Tax=Phytophthora boehmeriae TaxID=109152 RepID=A0A8T1X6V3_9STRA|nr:hypothetical protein PHYBOEH_010320 [Phytophthora boehmeriae]
MADTAKVAGDTSTLHDMQDSNEHMDSLASAAGLMQLSSAAAAADAEDAGANGSSGSDASLPPGWQRIVHGSGLPCYVHDGLGVVCWTRPYPLDVGGDGALSQPELHRLVKQHVPPLSIFASSSSTEQGLKGGAGAAEELATASPLPTSTQEPNSSLSKKRKLDGSVRDRTVQVKAQDKAGASKQQSMSLREFKMLSIGDPRVLQACMELSIKTPAQVLQEYQNRNRGVSINYNTVPVEGDGVRLFKTIVTAGSTVAELYQHTDRESNDGELRDSVGLTRHRIRVQPLVSTDGLCPNRFVVHAMEVTRNDQVGAFVSAGKHEKVYCFAAATSSTMIKWANAIHNWRRHPFDDPTSSALSVQDTITSKVKRIPNTPTSKQRAVLLENQKAGLVCLASRFDVKLTRPTDAFRKNSRGMCMPPSFRVRSVTKDPAEMKTPRRSFTFTSWLPTRISSFRSSLSGV